MTRSDEMVLKFRDVLKQTERYEPDALRAYQHNLLELLIRHAHRNTAYYRDRLCPVLRGGTFDPTNWADIPILTRSEAQKHTKALQANIIPPHMGVVSSDETSGSTGRPLRYRKNELMDVAALAMTDRLYRWWRFDGAKPMASFVSPRRKAASPDGTETFGWRSGYLTGRHYLLDTTGDVDRHLNWLARVGATYLASYSAMVQPLAERARDSRHSIQFDLVIARGGVVTDDARRICQEIFRGQLVDQYGADEIGQIACECPYCGEYHVSAEGVYCEVLDRDGNPAKPGEPGRVVLTNFYNYAMPLIRYEIGDYATVGQPDAKCRLKLPALSRIVGRYRNTFKLADGRTIFPNVPMRGFREFLSYRQIQIVQTAYDRLEVRYVPDKVDHRPDRQGLEVWLRDGLSADFRVHVARVEQIKRSSDGKFEDFLSLVDKG